MPPWTAMDETLILRPDPRKDALKLSLELTHLLRQYGVNIVGPPKHNFETSIWFQVVPYVNYFFSDVPNRYLSLGCPAENRCRLPAVRTISRLQHLHLSLHLPGEKWLDGPLSQCAN